MTTSVLNPVPGDHNLQALRDFALEAPFEWRRELEELIELRENAVEVEVAFDRLDEVKDAARDLLKSLEQSVEDLRRATDGQDVKGIAAALDDYEKEAAEIAAVLKTALDVDDACDAEGK